MDELSVTSKGQVTIPKNVRQALGIRSGTKVRFTVIGDRAELAIVNTPAEVPSTGFGIIKSTRTSVAVDFDVASLIQPK